MRTNLLRTAAATTLAFLLAGCAGSTGSTGSTDSAGSAVRPDPASTVVRAEPAGGARSKIASAKGARIRIYRDKQGAAERTITSPNDYGATRVFLVERDEGDWLQVLLPIRPNGSKGWIKAADVTLAETSHRVEIDRGAFRFTVYDGDRPVRTGKVATGEAGTPTPPGRYFFTELVKPTGDGGAYGAYAFGLSGFSPVLKSFAGGPGQLAIHGTNKPSAIGTRASHGCVRVGNDDITWMAKNLAIGTPVVVKG
ncbi:L,D-transpeptidase family protein [Nonomuraea sp. WAC 01424]|uniref:L,D-transpeptidase family protein n=1 Tax=Nonomuraea sp. WAC 01424 TaxID=2203200 RepID=UPI0021ADF2D9|nr:L,D-transpeptidase family protein [Nonomuraea sp. WAC 01424]